MRPKNSGGSTKFPGGHKLIHRTAQTAFVRVVTPRSLAAVVTVRLFEPAYLHGRTGDLDCLITTISENKRFLASSALQPLKTLKPFDLT